jgi:hypothetical protein
VHQYCLDLVVGVVGDGNCARRTTHRHAGQEGIARAPGSLFGRHAIRTGQSGHVGHFDGNRQAPVGGQRGDKGRIGVGFCAAHVVIQVGNV